MKKNIKKIFNKEAEIDHKIKEMEAIMASDSDVRSKIESIRLILEEIKRDIVETHIDSITDDLTGFLTKKHFKVAFEKIITDSCHRNIYISLLIIDIDNMKAINDNYGHLKGTEMIKAVSVAINKSIRKSDIVSRYGGDEFLILCLHSKEDGGQKVIDRIRKEISLLAEKENIGISVSIGHSSCPKTGEVEYKKMFLEADKSLYNEKKEKKIN